QRYRTGGRALSLPPPADRCPGIPRSVHWSGHRDPARRSRWRGRASFRPRRRPESIYTMDPARQPAGAIPVGGQSLSEWSDEALVSACRMGNQEAWRALLVRYQRLIYSVPLRLGLSPEQADDIFQQTCLRLFERLQSLRDPKQVRP